MVISPHSDGYGDAHGETVPRWVDRRLWPLPMSRGGTEIPTDLPFVERPGPGGRPPPGLAACQTHGEELDHGVLVPLSFLKARQIVSLSIVSSYEEHRTLGQLVRRCAEELGRDVLFVASGDLSHALTHGAPAPYEPRGKLFDDEVVRLLGQATLRPSAAWTGFCWRGRPSAVCAVS